jgi:dolichol-phosphate mannosyltransferase
LKIMMDYLKSLGLVMADHRRLVRFGLVGASGVLVNSALLYLLAEAGGLNHLVAAALATEASILYNFSLNDRWAFRDAKPGISWARRALRYNSVALAGLVISLLVLAVLTYSLNLGYLFANLFAIGAATLWNYAVNSCFTWPTVSLGSPSANLLAMPSSTKKLVPTKAYH